MELFMDQIRVQFFEVRFKEVVLGGLGKIRAVARWNDVFSRLLRPIINLLHKLIAYGALLTSEPSTGTREVVWRPAHCVNVLNLASWSSCRGRYGLRDEQQKTADIMPNRLKLLKGGARKLVFLASLQCNVSRERLELGS